VAVADPPADVIVSAVELEDTETASPPPLKVTAWGEPLALSVIINDPVRLPATVGVKITEIMQAVPTATFVPQVFVWAKSPDAAIDVMVSGAVPELFSVTICAALLVLSVCKAKVRLVGERVTAGAAGATPEPLSATICGELLTLSVIVSDPVRVPAAVGVNITEIEQVALTASELPQVSLSAKSPVAMMEAMESAALPELVSVMLCRGLELSTVKLLKLRAVLESVARGAPGLMVRVSADDVPPPGAGVDTVTCAVPEIPTSDAGTTAVS
jgi:hypothetical protein